MPETSDILILAAHPDRARSRVSARLMDAAQSHASRWTLHDLYRRYPDYAIDVAAEQRALAAARLVVMLHPLHWYSMPALQKLWVDEVLSFGWAYGPGGHALRGKDFWLVTSTGGSAEAYSTQGHHEHPIENFLLPYTQSVRICGMNFLPPLILHGAHQADEAALQQHTQTFLARLEAYPQWCVHESEASLPEVPLDARPALFSPLRPDAAARTAAHQEPQP